MRKALVVGIDYYKTISALGGCVNDAYKVSGVLERNSDGTKNFEVEILISSSEDSSITRKQLKNKIEELFNDKSEIALIYFAGHGHIESTGGYILTSECNDGDDGLPMNDLLKLANDSPALNKIIILDCCHSGIMGNPTENDDKAVISEGITIFTASSKDQYSVEKDGSGVFTTLFVDAMNGSASNLLGDITPGSIYAHVDQSLGFWGQRPIFKTNVTSFTTLRKVHPPIELSELKYMTTLFSKLGEDFKLDPSYEETSEVPNEENVKKFKLLQKYNRINLVIPVDAEHMYYAAIKSKSCKLTVLGEHYWNLITNKRI